MNKVNVLIFPSGSEGALDIYDSLKYNLHFNVFGASGKKNHTEFVFQSSSYYYGDDKLFVGNKEFLREFKKVLELFDIDYIIPTFDEVAYHLKKYENEFKAKIICSDIEVLEVANNKQLTYERLRAYDFISKTYEWKGLKEYPIFVKPKIGTGSQGVFIAQREEDLKLVENKEQVILCEYLPGKELSVDCFTNRNGELLFVGGRIRERIFHGIAARLEPVKNNKQIYEIAKILNEEFRFRGAWFFQVKEDEHGKLKLMEFSARQATNSGMYHKMGINFSALSIFDAMDLDLKLIFNDINIIADRRFKCSYKIDYTYRRVYIDFDDTLIVDGRVNTTAIKFLYQCVNKGKEIILLTKHEHDLKEALFKYKLDGNLFDQIIWIDINKNKSDYVMGRDSIFIDNYFKERLEVKERWGIPVFDVDAIDALIDESES